MATLIVIGGLIGFALGRAAGLLVGLFVGYAAGVLLKPLIIRRTLGTIQAQFVESTFAVMGALCKADGRVSRDEIQVAERQFKRLRLAAEQREAAKSAFRRGTDVAFALDAEVARFRHAVRGNKALLQMFLQIQSAAVAADGRLHPAARAMLSRVGRGLYLSEDAVRRMEALLGGAYGTRPLDKHEALDNAYGVLGVSPAASDAEVKRAYRRQINQSHPDKLASRGLPENMRILAEERTRAITSAYQIISQARA